MGNNVFATVWKLHTLGFSVIPSGGGATGKKPIIKWSEYQGRQPTEIELEDWNTTLKPRLWGIVTGAVSSLVVVDDDNAGGSIAMKSTGLEPQVITPRGGGHYYFRYPGHPVKTQGGVLPKVDIRGDGGFVNIVGDNKDGKYRIVSLPKSDSVYPWEQLPGEIRDAMNSGCKRSSSAIVNLVDTIPKGQRDAHLASLAGSMRRRGMSEDAILAALLVENKARCIPPLPDEQVQKITNSVGKYPPAPTASLAVASSFQLEHATEWPEPLAEEAFLGLAGEVVRTIEPHTEGDLAALLTNFLVTFGNCVGREPHARAEADRHSCNLNIVQVGDTSKGRKGSAWGHIRELFFKVDPVWTEQRIASGLSSGEGLIWEVRDRIEKVVKGEVEVMDEGITDKRLLAFEPEFSSALKVMTRQGNILSAIIRQAWDSGMMRVITKNSPAKATGAHISILGHVTKAELLRYLNDVETGNGFANRFLWFCVKRSKTLPEGGGCPTYQGIVPLLKAAIDRARKCGELKRDKKAKDLWAEIYPELSEGKPGLMGAVTARAEAQVLRLSVIYAALDGDREIRPAHLMAALAVWDYCEASARYIFGDVLGDSVADRIQEALQQSQGGLSRTNIYHLFSKHMSATRIEQALKIMQTNGRVRYEVMGTEGRPVEVWYAV